MKNLLFISLAVLTFKSYAGPLGFATSLELKQLTELSSPSHELPSEAILLPLSPGQDQGESSLCWTYSTLSLLESNIMHKHPEFGDVSFSRVFLQKNNAQERAIRGLIFKQEPFFERGTMSIALELISKYGLMPDDEREINSAQYLTLIPERLDALSTSEEKLSQITNIVNNLFFVTPKTVAFKGKTFTPKELGQFAIGNKSWLAYGFADVARGEWRTHPDTDAFKGAKAWFLNPTKKEEVILKSLKKGFPLAMFYQGHVVIIFGAKYDDQGKAISYYIKDSYASYTTEA